MLLTVCLYRVLANDHAEQPVLTGTPNTASHGEGAGRDRPRLCRRSLARVHPACLKKQSGNQAACQGLLTGLTNTPQLSACRPNTLPRFTKMKKLFTFK